MILEYLRLGFATLLVLLPGWLVARALGQRSTAATVAWALAAIFVAWTVVFAVHGSVWLAVGILAAIAVAAWLAGLRTARPPSLHWAPRRLVLGVGLILGLLLWRVSGAISGDGLFHEGRVRKLAELGDLQLRSVDEFADGGLHPGYAFPLWHGFEALIAKLSGLDPSVVVSHEASLLTPLACLLAWEAGVAVFGSSEGGLAVLAGQLGLSVFAAGHGGAYATLGLPGTAARQLLVPAAIALFFTYVESRRWPVAAALAAAFGAVALVHVTYALFALVPLAAYAVVRFGEWRRSAIALAAASMPTVLVALWLRPLVNETRSHNPDPAALAFGLAQYSKQLVVSSVHHYHLRPEVVSRSGAVAVAALALVPLAAFAARRRWSAYVLGGTVSILALLLVPALFVEFSDLVSLSQSRRAAGFIPFAFAFAGGLALLARSVLVLPAALGAGIALQILWPGDFVYGLREGGPAAVTWWALIGGAVALVVGVAFRRRVVVERAGRGALAAWLFVLPIAVYSFSHWSPLHPSDPDALSPAIAGELRALPPRSVVLGPVQMSYRIAAAAPVYVVAAPAVHVANTNANLPFERVRDVEHWLATGDPAIPRKYGATWAVRDGHLYRLTP